MALAGYNIAFKIGVQIGQLLSYRVFAGRTQDDLTIAARTKERITKDDAGSPQVGISGHDITFRATGLVDLDSQFAITRNDLVAMALASGTSAVFNFEYATDGDDMLSGQCVITNLAESSNATDDATLTVDFRVVGDATFDDDITTT